MNFFKLFNILDWFQDITKYYNNELIVFFSPQGRKMVRSEKMLDLITKLTSLLLQIRVSARRLILD